MENVFEVFLGFFRAVSGRILPLIYGFINTKRCLSFVLLQEFKTNHKSKTMKKLLLAFAVIGMTFNVGAQIETPQPSPIAKVEQKVGLTDISIEYSRPNMRGRTIFGDLVPYNTMWRTGANANTKITFSDGVTIGGKELKAGSYAVFTKPNTDNWDVYFYVLHVSII